MKTGGFGGLTIDKGTLIGSEVVEWDEHDNTGHQGRQQQRMGHMEGYKRQHSKMLKHGLQT